MQEDEECRLSCRQHRARPFGKLRAGYSQTAGRDGGTHIIFASASKAGPPVLPSPAPAGGKVVTLGANSFQMTIPSSVTVPAGAKTATFTIQALTIRASANVRMYASVNGQGVRTTIKLQP